MPALASLMSSSTVGVSTVNSPRSSMGDAAERKQTCGSNASFRLHGDDSYISESDSVSDGTSEGTQDSAFVTQDAEVEEGAKSEAATKDASPAEPRAASSSASSHATPVKKQQMGSPSANSCGAMSTACGDCDEEEQKSFAVARRTRLAVICWENCTSSGDA